MVTVHLFLIVLAGVFFLLAGLGIPEYPRLKYVGWGLFFWLISTIVMTTH